MANTFFQFKQFRIEQDKCGMKVTTDACFFGASIVPIQRGRILDVGTGTGLLSLMMAQRTSAQIDAIEINSDAYSQAVANFRNAPWSDQLSVFHTSLQEFQPKARYDQIICNPPFFVNSFQGKSGNKNQAIHANTLSMEDLAHYVASLMDNEAEFWLMYPDQEMQQFIPIALEHGLFPQRQTTLRNTEPGPIFRQIISFGKQPRNLSLNMDVYIKEIDGSYSKAFINYLKDFYLHL